jgi:hypothetical protein
VTEETRPFGVLGGGIDIYAGTENRREARAELRRQQRAAAAAALPRLELAELEFQPVRGYVLHEPTGDLLRVYAGEVWDVAYGPTAYYAGEDGEPVFLMPA